jgi:hypothetical protein
MTSRRSFVRLALGGLAGGALALGTARDRAEAARCPDGQRRCRGECIPETACCRDNECPDPGVSCQRRACLEGVCGAEPVPDGRRCDDGDACTGRGTCVAGACQPGEPVTCPQSDNPCQTVACNPATGECGATPLADGTNCDDGNPCTRDDTCQNGECVPGAELPCAAGMVCADVRCNPDSGVCDLIVPLADGTPCASGDLCAPDGACRAGGCSPGEPVVCEVEGQCVAAAVCNPDTGRCEDTYAPDGTECDDEDPCTRNDVCVAGACRGTPLDCSDSDGPCSIGRCNPQIGACEVVPRDDDTPCDDADPCTEPGVCRSGVCQPGPRLECPACQTCVDGGCVSICSPGDVCSGTSCCTPEDNACGARGKNCGTVTNNCGQTIACGTCPGGMVCTNGVCTPNGGGGCFVAGTRVAMADGTSKPIELVEADNRVLGREGKINRVVAVVRPLLGDRPLYALRHRRSPVLDRGGMEGDRSRRDRG